MNKSCDLILPYVIKSVRQLENAKVDFIIMPCNTLHKLIPQIRKETNIEVLDLVEEVSRYVVNKYRTIGLLCTNKTRNERLYDNNLSGINIIYPNQVEQNNLSQIILRIIRNSSTQYDLDYLSNIIEKMIKLGAEKVVLGCTDLANLVKDNPYTLDSTDVLIKMILNKMS